MYNDKVEVWCMMNDDQTDIWSDWSMNNNNNNNDDDEFNARFVFR